MDMIAIDIGNSAVKLAAFKDAKLAQQFNLTHQDLADKLPNALQTLRETCGPQPYDARTVPVLVSSVNAQALAAVEQIVGDTFEQNIKLMGRDIMIPFKYGVPEPEKVGTDRLLTAMAAFDMLDDAVVVADIGSAITVDCVSHQGIFLGGAILPGMNLGAQALHDHTDALPLVTPVSPTGAYGIDTQSAIEHGLYYTALGAVRCLVERYAEDLGRWPHLILTGGQAELLAQQCDFADSVVPNLCLTGIYLAFLKFTVAQQNEQDQQDQTQDDQAL